MEITVPHLKNNADVAIGELWNELIDLPRQALKNDSWPAIASQCRADFVIAYTGQYILVMFFIENDHFNSIRRPVNGDVHLDNCVEFFISFDQSDKYYNIEFNALGNGKVAYGQNNGQRLMLDESIVRNIKTKIESTQVAGSFNWTMLMKIPAAVFIHHQIESFSGMQVNANFYKCGDQLPDPHYLCWSRIDVPAPDFHQPKFFGKVEFAKETTLFLQMDTFNEKK